MTKFRGTGIAIITPFKANKEIDFTALESLINYWIKNKVEYLVVMGTTGESVTLSQKEKIQLFDFCIEKINKRVPLVIGIGGNNTAAVIESFKDFDLSKADAILSVSPYYNKPTQEGIYRHYAAIAKASPLPIILYNVPGRTMSNITAATTLRLAKDFSNIIAVKEASGNLEQVAEIIENKPERFLVISGDDNLTLPILALGGDGVISVSANAFTLDFSNMVRAVLAGDLATARTLHYKLFTLTKLLFEEGNPTGIKESLKLMNLCGNNVRLPLVEASDSLSSKLQDELTKQGYL